MSNGVDAAIRDIERAFAAVEFPGAGRLVDGDEGEERRMTAEVFRRWPNWRTIPVSDLDGAPYRCGSALSFLSREALQYYVPAYMIASLRGLLEMADPTHHLTAGLSNKDARELVNPKRFKDLTWRDYALNRFALFSQAQAGAIVLYLLAMKDRGCSISAKEIQQSLDNYWLPRSYGRYVP